MTEHVGPLLEMALERIQASQSEEASLAIAAHFGGGHEGPTLPVVVQLPPEAPQEGEGWAGYKERMNARLAPRAEMFRDVLGVNAKKLYAANALQAELTPKQIELLRQEGEDLFLLELDPVVQVTAMDDAVEEIDLPSFQIHHHGIDGAGVVVAVLDSGIDQHHPYLTVADSVSTCGESVDIPGSHGTHCAGSIASRDSFYPGVAPGVTLLNIKVLTADGRGKHTYITAGIDEALDRGAQVLSMSVGFNHLPVWSSNGHGWSCPDGRCPLCTAVDNASALDNVVVVVAAGNEHERAEALHKWGYGHTFDTELGCPGHARHAITVAAITKQQHLPAPFSSHGPTAYGLDKPDLGAPGVNITSTIPVPRQPDGKPVANPQRSQLFGRKSGTSMATPIVAGAAALLVQMADQAAAPWTPASIKQHLMTKGVLPAAGGPTVTGAGRLNLGAL